MRQRAAASLLYQSQYAEPAFRNLLNLIFLKIVGRILAFYTWVLYEEYKYKGYTQSKSFDIPQDNGTSITRVNTMWTQKGRMFLYKFLKEKYGALPIVERDENYVQPYGLMSSTAKRMAKSKKKQV